MHPDPIPNRDAPEAWAVEVALAFGQLRGNRIEVRLSQAELARVTGRAAGTVARNLTVLAHRGLLLSRRPTIVLTDRILSADEAASLRERRHLAPVPDPPHHSPADTGPEPQAGAGEHPEATWAGPLAGLEDRHLAALVRCALDDPDATRGLTALLVEVADRRHALVGPVAGAATTLRGTRDGPAKAAKGSEDLDLRPDQRPSSGSEQDLVSSPRTANDQGRGSREGRELRDPPGGSDARGEDWLAAVTTGMKKVEQARGRALSRGRSPLPATDPARILDALSRYSAAQVTYACERVAAQLDADEPLRSPYGILHRAARAADRSYLPEDPSALPSPGGHAPPGRPQPPRFQAPPPAEPPDPEEVAALIADARSKLPPPRP